MTSRNLPPNVEIAQTALASLRRIARRWRSHAAIIAFPFRS